MHIDASLVTGYLRGQDGCSGHWLFRRIAEDGSLLLDWPSPARKREVGAALEEVQNALVSFRPYNHPLFAGLFPDWEARIAGANVLLAVGCPAPYDAMVREHEGKEYIILDLVRLLEYGREPDALVTQLLTHELAHVCLYVDYPNAPEELTYPQRLGYIAFNEGFAHLLAFRDDIERFDFGPFIRKHYGPALQTLRSALAETDPQRQAAYLQAADCGPYWEKYAAVCGQLYLAARLRDLNAVYARGPGEFLQRLLAEG